MSFDKRLGIFYDILVIFTSDVYDVAFFRLPAALTLSTLLGFFFPFFYFVFGYKNTFALQGCREMYSRIIRTEWNFCSVQMSYI